MSAMGKWKLVTAMLCAASSVCAEYKDNSFSLFAEFVYMRRNEIHGHKLVLDSTKTTCKPCNDFSVMSTNTLVQHILFEPGYRVGFNYMRHKRWSLEGNYLSITGWKGKKTVHGEGTLSFPFSNNNYVDYSYADKATGKYFTEFHSAELNYWNHMTPRSEDYFSVSWLLGIRYMYIPEKFRLAFHKGSDTSHYKIDTQNYMGGGQVGLNVQWNPMLKLSWDLTTKIGECLNYARDNVFLGDQNDTVVLHHFDKHKYASTFFVDLAVTLGYQFTSHFNTHVGYQMIYLTGLALAPEQVDKRVKGEERLIVNGEAVVQGVYVGAGWTF